MLTLLMGPFELILWILLVLTCLLLLLVILMQRPRQEGLGAAFGADITTQIWGSGTTDFLKKSTVFLTSSFFVLSLTLSMMRAHAQKGEETVGAKLQAEKVTAIPAEATPASATSTPIEIPAGQNGGSIQVTPGGTTAPIEIKPTEAPKADVPAAPVVEPVKPADASAARVIEPAKPADAPAPAAPTPDAPKPQ
jgi:preprotein translocase subunit SecG